MLVKEHRSWVGVSWRVFKDLEIQRSSELGEVVTVPRVRGPGGCVGQPTALREGLEHCRDRS